jgi:hypothetical protein
MIEQ